MFDVIFIIVLTLIAVLAIIFGSYGISLWMEERKLNKAEFTMTVYYPEDEDQDELDDDENDYEYDDDDDDEDEDDYDEDAAEVNSESTITRIAHTDWIAIQDHYRLVHRAKYPRLYSDDWFAQSYRELSLWAVEMARDEAKYRRRMKLAA